MLHPNGDKKSATNESKKTKTPPSLEEYLNQISPPSLSENTSRPNTKISKGEAEQLQAVQKFISDNLSP